VNIALKFILVWGFHLGIAGIALGTSIGAWTNVGLLAFFGRRRDLLRLNSEFWRSLAPVALAAVVTGAAAYAAVVLGRGIVHANGPQQVVLLGFAIVASCLAYGAVVILFRDRLPLGRLGRMVGARA